MKLRDGLHLTYCTNVHRGEDWPETFDGLQQYTLAVREKIAGGKPFGIGLRLSNRAARELSDPQTLKAFRHWLDKNDCYVFTINGFPFGQFHGSRVKEQVFRPDWTTRDRLEYTNLLFDLLDEIAPKGLEASVSTLPGSHKSFMPDENQVAEIRRNVWRCVEHITRLSEKTGRPLHLGVEPEPLGLFENSAETVRFFDQLAGEHPNDTRLKKHLGVNYDTCHFAIQYEKPKDVVKCFRDHGIKISKIHLSSALKVRSTQETCAALSKFAEDVYLHQVIARSNIGDLTRYHDLDLALAAAAQAGWPVQDWRIHFHVPLHTPDMGLFSTTSSDIAELFRELKPQPGLCSHFEIETYTWEVLPSEFRNDTVVTQIAREYEWCLEKMRQCDFA